MEYKIEKNVPMIAKIETKFPFSEMEVGDSFEVSFKTKDERNKKRQLVNNCFLLNKSKLSPEFKHATKTTSETTFRVWRIK